MPPATEHEGAPPPFRLTDGFSQVFKNEQPPFAAALFNFAILVFIYWRFGKKPIAEGLKARKNAIAQAIENAKQILREARARAKRYRGKLEQVEVDAEHGKAAIVGAGQGEAEAILRAAEEKAQRIERDAKFLLEQEKKQTELDLVRETVERAASQAEKLLHSTVSMDDHERLAEEFISKLAQDYQKGLSV